MQLLRKIKHLRRMVMGNLTRHLAHTTIPDNVDLRADVQIRTVLITRPNHRLGNLLMITPLVQEVSRTLPEAKIDLFVKGRIAPVLFKNYPRIRKIIQLPKKPLKNLTGYAGGWITLRRSRYDLVINVVNHSSSGKISAWMTNAKYRFLGDINDEIRLNCAGHEHMARYPVYSFRSFIQKVKPNVDADPVPPLDMKLSSSELETGRALLLDLVQNGKPTICLYTYATGAKCYPSDWWSDFYEKLCVRYPEYNVVEMLPIENVSQINFRAPSFYSKDLRQIAGFIANTNIFIGADSGMMHLASASHTPTLGLFKTTSVNTYAPFYNNSRGINTNETSIDDIVGMVTSMTGAVTSSEVE